MTITEAEGQEFAAKFTSAFIRGFNNNNHDETMKGMFGEKVYLSSPDGTEGEFSYEGVLKYLKEWGSIVDNWIVCKPLVSVDTDQSRIVISTEPVFNIPGGGLVTGGCVEILLLNDSKQVVRWSGVWDPNNKQLLDAMAKVSKKPSLHEEMLEPKEPKMSITLKEGRAFADAFLKAQAEGFAKNNHKAICHHLFADQLSWDWSDGTKGEGSYDEIMNICAKSWGTMIGSCLYSDPTIAVDTNRSVIAIAYQICINITGGFKDENNPILLNKCDCFHLNEEKKIFKWNICWNNNDPALQTAVTKIKKRLEATDKSTKSIDVAAHGMAALQHAQLGQ